MLTAADSGIRALFLYLRRPAFGQQNRGRGWGRELWVLLAVLAAILLSHSIAASSTAALPWPPSTAAQVKQVRRVLIFYDVGLSSPAIELLDQQIRNTLEASPFQIELYREYLEATLFPDPTRSPAKCGQAQRCAALHGQTRRNSGGYSPHDQ